MKKCKKMYLLFAIINILLVLFSIQSYANTTTNSPSSITMNSVISAGDTFIERGKKGLDSTGNKITTFNGFNFQKTIKQAFRFLYTIGMALSVIISAILGIKIMIAAPEEKAEIKEKLIPYIIGCVVMFGAFSIWSIVMKFAAQVQ